MAVHNLCDVCGKDLNKEAYQRGLIARLKRGILPHWKFWGVMPTKSGFNDMWELNRTHLDLCQQCTKDFFAFVKKKMNRPVRKSTVRVSNAKPVKKTVAVKKPKVAKPTKKQRK